VLLECAVDRVALSNAASRPVRPFGRCSSERGAGIVVEASTTQAILGMGREPVKLARRQLAKAWTQRVRVGRARGVGALVHGRSVARGVTGTDT
jgi:hypothetical protein